MGKAPVDPRFVSLTILDVLQAREANHRLLLSRQNVVGTAVGKYLVRKADREYRNPTAAWAKPVVRKRTLVNSAVTEASLPCVLVFVDKWFSPEEMRTNREDYIPASLPLPGGRAVPTCLVCAHVGHIERQSFPNSALDRHLLGAGYPVTSDVQGQVRVGTVGALVTDGHSVFALTNRHVAGPPGQVAAVRSRSASYPVGVSADPSLREVPFARAYPTWAAYDARIKLDAGLIRVARADDWSAQVYGLGRMGPPVDLHEDSMTLDLIGKDVRAFGGVSGPLTGSIRALFYRYRAFGGVEYVTDFLIGPREGDKSVPTQHGDSGSLWFLENQEGPCADDQVVEYRPFAMQWGASRIGDETRHTEAQFALATNLTPVLRELEVDVIRDWNLSSSETWGAMGHYQVGASACDLVASPKLALLLEKNRAQIGLTDAQRRHKQFPKKGDAFIALADVSDYLWRDVRRAEEKPGHHADLDQERADGETLMSLFEADPASLNKDTWLAFYAGLGIPKSKAGSLPFRVKQFYEAMVGYVRARKVPEFVAAAGILAHYVGDAAQPLHASFMHNGVAAEEKGVHSQYETKMMSKYRREIVDGVDNLLRGYRIASTFNGGQRAAEVTMELSRYALQSLPPRQIIDAYVEGKQTSNTNDHMWSKLGSRTIDLVAEGAMYLAEIWESAWLEGGGEGIGLTHMKAVSESRLSRVYSRKSFVRSKYLKDM